MVYVGSETKLYALNASTGALLWSYASGGRVLARRGERGGLFRAADGNLYALNASTGAKLWSYAARSGHTSPAVANGVVYVGCATATCMR